MKQKNIDRKLLIDILDDFSFGSHDIETTADRIFASIRNTNIIDEWLDKNGCPEINKQVEEEALELEKDFVFTRIKDINPYPIEGIFYPVYAKGALQGFEEFRKPLEQKTIEQVFEWLTTHNYLTDLKETLIENYNNFKKTDCKDKC